MKTFEISTLFVLAVSVCAKVSYDGYQVIRIEPRDGAEREFLRRLGDYHNLQFWKEPERAFGPVDVLVPENKLEAVKEILWLTRVSFVTMIEDVEKAILAQISPRKAQFTLEDFEYDKYHSFEEIQAWMENFATEHSQYVTKMVVGTSYEKRTFHALKISTGGSQEKPAFAIDCGIHACEWIGPATCTNVIRYLTEEAGKSSEIGMILNAVDFYIIPSSNPDGYEYTWSTNRLWRKTRSKHPGSTCVGVDPNRNWDSNFGGNGSSNVPCSDDYHGPMAWSEANVRAQRDFVQGIKNLHAYIDVHSYSQLWMFPYGYTFDKPKDFNLLTRIANESARAIKEKHNMTYTPGQISKIIYVASGSTADYFYDHLKLKCVFAAELRDTGKYGMLLPEYEIIPTAEEAFAGLMVIASNIKEGNCGPDLKLRFNSQSQHMPIFN